MTSKIKHRHLIKEMKRIRIQTSAKNSTVILDHCFNRLDYCIYWPQ